jgi:acetyl esterase
MANAKGTPALRALVLFWPVTHANFENASYDEFANDHILTKNMMKWFWDAYTTDPKQRQEIYASPLLATTAQLNGLPPTLVQSAEKDVLRDEGEAYPASSTRPA